MGGSRLRKAASAACIVTGAALVAGGVAGAVTERAHLPGTGAPPKVAAAPSVQGRDHAPPRQAAAAAPSFAGAASTTASGEVAAGATLVAIPSLGVTAPAVAVSESASSLEVPDDPSTVGWWTPAPGVLVLDGHVDSRLAGVGALFRLQALRPGAAIDVSTQSGVTEHWTVQGLRTYGKGQLPAELFTGPGPRLVIVTCGGPFDAATGHYQDNVVAYGAPTG